MGTLNRRDVVKRAVGLATVGAGGFGIGRAAGQEDKKDVPLVEPPRPAAPAVTTEAIHSQLKQLAKWSEFRAYACYFVLFPRAIPGTADQSEKLLDLRSLFAGEVQALKMNREGKKVNPYYNEWKESGDGEAHLYIRLRVPDAFAKLPNLAEKDKLFIDLDALADPVPAPAAEVMAVGFRQGFISRVVLGHYVRAWDQHAPDIISTGDLDFANGWSIAGDDVKSLSKFGDPNQYLPAGKGKPQNFESGLTALLRTHNLQLRGMLLGWKAASQLALETGVGPEQRAALELIRLTNTPDDVGELTAYTLHYLSGYFQIVEERELKKAQRLTTNEAIASQLARGEAVKEAKAARDVFHQFAELLIDEHHAIVLGGKPAAQKSELPQRHALFLKGFVRGSMKAADELASLGYKVGYEDGFRDGYSRGYADGHRDGFTQGQQKASSRCRSLFGSIGRWFAKNKGKIGDYLKKVGEEAGKKLVVKIFGG